jgi:RNA polymerase sigma-54 factor
VEAEDINIDEYLSDDTPDYKTQTNNYSDEDRRIPLAAPVSSSDLINQLNTFILNDDERDIAEFLVVVSTTWAISVAVSQILYDDMALQGLYTDKLL